MKQPLIALSLAVVLALCAAFMAPAPAGLLHGVVLAGSGALLVMFRPCRPLPRMVAPAGSALFLWSLAAFLPVSWFGIPEWRSHLVSSGVIDLGTLVSPQPQHTLAGCFLLGASIATGLFLLTQTLEANSRIWLASAFAIGVSAYAALSYYAKATGWMYPGTTRYGEFGFFPNKNHTASFLMLGGFASLGAFAGWLHNRRFAEAAAVAAAGAVTVTGLVTRCNSRAGTLLFGLGALIWLVRITRRGFERRVIILCWIAAIIVGTIFFAFDSAARGRIEKLATHALGAPGENKISPLDPNSEAASGRIEDANESLDFRELIWSDTLKMIRAQPLAGVGLGNFRYVFPQFRNASRTEALCLHPESSLLQLSAEAGLPALAALLWLLAAVIAGTGSSSSRGAWLVRSALATGAAMFLLHCCVDVPGTRVGTLWPAFIVAALALSPDPRSKAPDAQPSGRGSGFIYIGLLMLGAGLWLLSGGLESAPGSGPAAGFQMQERVFHLHRGGFQDEAIEFATQASRTSPLDPEFYFQWGTLELPLSHTGPLVDSLYLAERLAEPIKTQTPLREAGYWVKFDPAKAIPLFSDALRRASLFHLSTYCTTPEEVYAQVLTLAAGNAQLRGTVKDLAAGEPNLLLLWLQAGPPEGTNGEIREILAKDPGLARWDDAARRGLFRLWSERGGRAQLLDALRQIPEWDAAGWPFLAGEAANQKAFQAGCAIIFKYLPCPAEPEVAQQNQDTEDTELFRARYGDRPTPASAEALARAYYRGQDFDAVLQLAEEAAAAKLASPAMSALAYHAAVREGHWDTAWQWAVDFVRQTDASATPE
jgi:hypothetical protein